MFTIYLLLLGVAHLIGDVYWQNQTYNRIKSMFFYLLPFGLLLYLLPISNLSLALVFLLILGFVYGVSSWFSPYFTQTANLYKFLKVISLFILLVVFAWWFSATTTVEATQVWQRFFTSKSGALVKFVCLSVWLFKPANTTFKLVFAKYQYTSSPGPKDWPLLKSKASTVEGAGAVIGNLERVMMGLFLLLNQYAAIGLILTAKSITRYNKMTSDPAFSEYYLIGTLYSLLATLIPYILVFHFV